MEFIRLSQEHFNLLTVITELNCICLDVVSLKGNILNFSSETQIKDYIWAACNGDLLQVLRRKNSSEDMNS